MLGSEDLIVVLGLSQHGRRVRVEPVDLGREGLILQSPSRALPNPPADHIGVLVEDDGEDRPALTPPLDSKRECCR
jgi:hypothetical protein